MKFHDEFNNSSLNTSVWTRGWFGNGMTDFNGDCLDSRNVSEPGDGDLHLRLTAENVTCGGASGSTAGAMVSSNPGDHVSGHTGWQYTDGYIEWRAYLPPSSSGVIANWPGLWTDGQTWPTDGEDDVMEGGSGKACWHFHSSAGGPGSCASGNYAGWHVFGAEWEGGVVTYYYDGVKVGQISSGITSAPMYVIMDVVARSPQLVPADMLIDYVRAWQ